MLNFVLKKMWNKKWFTVCLLLGFSLIVAVMACHPMFEEGASDEILYRALCSYAEKNKKEPAAVSCRRIVSDFSDMPDDRLSALKDRQEEQRVHFLQGAGLSEAGSQTFFAAPATSMDTNYGGRGLMLQIGRMEKLEEHIDIVKSADQNSGASLKDNEELTGEKIKTQQNETDIIPCFISEYTMDAYHLVAGEILTASKWRRKNGMRVRLKIQKIFRDRAEEGDVYWYRAEEEFGGCLFLGEEEMRQFVSECSPENIACEQTVVYETESLRATEVSGIFEFLKKEVTEGKGEITTPLVSILETVHAQSENVRWLLWVLELPFFVLLFLFLYMVTGQLILREEGEIILLRRRGATRWEIFCLYGVEALILSAAGLVIGIVLGTGLCKLAAGTDTFLHFAGKNIGQYHFRGTMFLYGLAACGVSSLFLLIPAWQKSRLTNRAEAGNVSMNRKKKSHRYETGRDHVKRKKVVWETCFLDIILLGVSIYLFYQTQGQTEAIAERLREGGSLDPMLFLNESLFLFSGGLFMIRLISYAVRGVGWLGRNYWSAVLYASFLQITRGFSERWLLSVFLIMTVAGGIFDAELARTVNENTKNRLEYNVGCDLRVAEQWEQKKSRDQESGQILTHYIEPDIGAYDAIKNKGLADSYTKVRIDEEATVSFSSKTLEHCMLMEIHTKEFGETARLMDGLNKEHWFKALNKLAEDENGVIISRNLAESCQLEVGDTLSCQSYAPNDTKQEFPLGVLEVNICAIVDAFPGFDPYGGSFGHSMENDAQRCLLVVNYGTGIRAFGMMPYEIWMHLTGDTRADEVKDLLGDALPEKWESREDKIIEMRGSPTLQITNGLFTMGFFISLVVCLVGFLIVWVLSVQGRTLSFGVFRAMGMSLLGVYRMLIHEQICCSVLPMVAGGFLGGVASVMFVKVLSLVYLPERHIMPIRIYRDVTDFLWEMAFLGIMVLLCIIVLAGILKKMRISEALKMGE